MGSFRGSQFSPDVQRAFEALSDEGRRVILTSKGGKKRLVQLVGKVGVNEAIELSEVSLLMSYVRLWLYPNAVDTTRAWENGPIQFSDVVESLSAAGEEFELMLTETRKRVDRYGRYPASMDVVMVSRRYGFQVLSGARKYCGGSPDWVAPDAEEALKLFDATSDAWELATVSWKLPLVGDKKRM